MFNNILQRVRRNQGNIRATPKPPKTWLDEPDDIESLFSEKPTRKRKQYQRKGTHARKQDIMAYLVRKGHPVSQAQIAKNVGISMGHVSHLLRDLQATKTIRRTGKSGSYVYTAVRKRVNRKRGATVPAPTTPQPEKPVTPTPEVHDSATEKVYKFIASHEDKLISQADIARGSGVSTGMVANAAKRLADEGRIVRSLPVVGQGTRYWLASSTVDGPNILPAVIEKSELLCTLESLAFAFMRETRKNDVLKFLEWLESQDNLNKE